MYTRRSRRKLGLSPEVAAVDTPRCLTTTNTMGHPKLTIAPAAAADAVVALFLHLLSVHLFQMTT